MEVIKQELKEWDEDLEQYTEDKLYYNCMENRRIKYPIIGTEESLNNITIYFLIFHYIFLILLYFI